jgi:hypothetical protein
MPNNKGGLIKVKTPIKLRDIKREGKGGNKT